jgi:molecular chaperone IbpA
MRQSVGFDRFNDLFESLLNQTDDRFDSYPPYNIEKRGENAYQITLAVAGFSESDLDITVKEDTLTISGKITQTEKDQAANYLHRGIASRAFERTFRLADHIRVEDASLKDGLLSIALVREVPEEKKPRMIPINGFTRAETKGLLGTKKKSN